jgi:hypothetical protein
VAAGIVLDDFISSQVSPGTGGFGAGHAFGGGGGIGVGGVLIGVGVIVTAGIIASNNNHGTTTSEPIISSSSSNTGNLVVTVDRAVRARTGATRNNATTLGSTSVASAASFGSAILGSSPFRGSLSGPTLAVGADDGVNPSIVGRLPLGHNLQLHLGALYNRSDMFNNMTEVDLGIDYFLDSTHSLGAGLRSQTFNALDPLGTSTSTSSTTPELRYTVRY